MHRQTGNDTFASILTVVLELKDGSKSLAVANAKQVQISQEQ